VPTRHLFLDCTRDVAVATNFFTGGGKHSFISPAYHKGLEDYNGHGDINTGADSSTSGRNLIYFSLVTVEFMRFNCVPVFGKTCLCDKLSQSLLCRLYQIFRIGRRVAEDNHSHIHFAITQRTLL